MSTTGVVTRRWRALGTIAEVTTTDPNNLDLACQIVAAEVLSIDVACSRFSPSSELMLIPADGVAHAVSPLLTEAIGAALHAARITGGAVDPTVLGSMLAIGYSDDFAVVATRPEPPAPPIAVAAPGWRSVTLDRMAGRLTLPPGVHLDLGATAKALAADRAAAAASRAGITGTLVNLGGDIAVSGEPPACGWGIRVADDHAANDGPVIRLHGGGVATSSITVRRWSVGGQQQHHIVDPRTGRPADGLWRTVSVAADSCCAANAAATAAIVWGRDDPAWIARQGLPARLVSRWSGVARTGGWPADDEPFAA